MTIAYRIVQDQKIIKQNIKQLYSTTDTSSGPSTPSYIYDRLNENSNSNTTVVLPPHFDTSIQPQHNSDSDASEGAKDVASDLFDQSNKHHYNTYDKDNDDSQ